MTSFWIKSLPYLRKFVREVEKTATINKASGDPDPYKSALRSELQRLECRLAGTMSEIEATTIVGEPVTMELGRLISPIRLKSFMFHRDRELKDAMRHVVYVVRDGDVVLYVGSTRRGARTRLKAHVNHGSILGSAIKRERNSHTWTVEMIPMASNRLAIEKERSLIRGYRPKYSLQ